MCVFQNWRRYAVHQKRAETGCIPTAYEMILRSAGMQGIKFETFQDEFDLDQNGGVPRNNFDSVAQAIKAKYPDVSFGIESFPKGEGIKKMSRIETLIAQKRPVIVSLSNAPFKQRGWHIMVVVDATDTDLTLLQHVDERGTPHTMHLSKAKFVYIHDNFNGGDDIAYLS